MAMTVQRRKDSKLPHVFMHKIADVRGGVSVKVADLGNDFLHEGAVLSAPVNGICNVVKVGRIAATSTGTEIKVKKGHNFKIGDFVLAKIGGVAYAITAISYSNKEYDVITVKTTLGTLNVGDFIVEAKGESSSTESALKYVPFAVVGTGKPILAGDNINTDAWLIGVTYGNPLPDFVAEHLKGIINY